MRAREAEDALPASRQIRKTFDKASKSFATASIVHTEARERLLERLDFVKLVPRTMLDLGCGPAAGAASLAQRYPDARVLAMDSSRSMLQIASGICATERRVSTLAGDAERLPLRPHCIELLLANMLLPWCRPDAVFAEAARVLNQHGLLMFATLGPDSLQEIRRAWVGVDEFIHVHGFFDMHDLGDLAVSVGLKEPVMDVDRIELTYPSVRAIVADLRACGGSNIARGRRRSLTGRHSWQRFEQSLSAGECDGRISITVELILGQAWGAGSPAQAQATNRDEIAIPIDRIRRNFG